MNKNIFLSHLFSIGLTHKDLWRISEKNKNYEQIFREKISDSFLIKNKIPEKRRTIILEKYKIFTGKHEEDYIAKNNIQIISHSDKKYPKNLLNISNPPYFFYLRGNIDQSPKLAIVGTRKITSYGKQVIQKIVPELGKYFTIVSGGAFGCDTHAHKESLANNHTTIAVIGTGIDLCYPQSNDKLYEQIVEKEGGVISIFPIGTPGSKYSFPIRNEIVAGISEGTIIIEAKEKSGSLITAQLTLDSGRDLFAVPGSIFSPYSGGTNMLIKKGYAKAVTQVEDILEEYNISTKNPETKPKQRKIENPEQEAIYNILLTENMNLNQLGQKLGKSISNITQNITLLELSGYIQKNEQGNYQAR